MEEGQDGNGQDGTIPSSPSPITFLNVGLIFELFAVFSELK